MQQKLIYEYTEYLFKVIQGQNRKGKFHSKCAKCRLHLCSNDCMFLCVTTVPWECWAVRWYTTSNNLVSSILLNLTHCVIHLKSLYRVVQKKIANSLMHRHFAAVCSSIKRLSPKCSEMVTVYQAMNTCISWITIFYEQSELDSLHLMSDVTLHVNMIPLTDFEDRLLIDYFATWKGWIVENNDCWVPLETK